MNGFIKLHRRMVEWEWYTDVPTKTLFLHLLLMANYEDAKWRGKTVKRGQRITSIRKLAEETGLSVKQVRTALDKLERTGEVAREGANSYTLITIENYAKYQDKREDKGTQEGTPQGKQKANEGQTKGNKQEIKKNKKENIIKNEKKIDTPGMDAVYRYRELVGR